MLGCLVCSVGLAPIVELQLTLCLLNPSFCAIWAGFFSPAIFWPALTGFFGLVPVPCDSYSSCATRCLNRLHPNKQVFPGAVFFRAAQTRPPLGCGALCTPNFCFLTLLTSRQILWLPSGLSVSSELAVKPPQNDIWACGAAPSSCLSWHSVNFGLFQSNLYCSIAQ